MHLHLLCTYTYTCKNAYYAHHICMYPYIHIYMHIYISILHTYTHRIPAIPHLAHVLSLFSQKKNVVASTVISPAACSLASQISDGNVKAVKRIS